jgi:hypothetical protein
MWLGYDYQKDAYHVSDFDNNTHFYIERNNINPKLLKMEYGKYKGLTLSNINDDDPRYIDWLKENATDMLLLDCLKNL